MKLLTSKEAGLLDKAAAKRFHLPVSILMENAGVAIIRHLLPRIPKPSRVVVLAGSGNNGGDGLVAARHLFLRGVKQLDVLLLASPQRLKGQAKENYLRAKSIGVKIHAAATPAGFKKHRAKIKSADLILDAMLGTGLRRPVRGVSKLAIEAVNSSSANIVSVDIPSGVSADSGHIHGVAVQATSTVTFGLPKVGLYLYPGRECAGEIHVENISFPPQLLEGEGETMLITKGFVTSVLPRRSPLHHKGTKGHLLDIVGSAEKPGAAVLSSLGAFRIGAGLVTTASDREARSAIVAQQPEIMTESFPTNEQEWKLLSQGKGCVAFGPGIEPVPPMTKVLEWVARSKLPVVLDAGGLTILASHPGIFKWLKRHAVLTPHPGEMSRLTGLSTKEIQGDRLSIAKKYAKKHHIVLVLKGASTIVAAPNGRAWINPTGNVALATAGTGDVLTGMIAGLITQGVKPLDAALCGVYLHGLLADKLRESKGTQGIVATDLLETLPSLLHQLQS